MANFVIFGKKYPLPSHLETYKPFDVSVKYW